MQAEQVSPIVGITEIGELSRDSLFEQGFTNVDFAPQQLNLELVQALLGRGKLQAEPVGEILEALRETFQSFISVQIEDSFSSNRDSAAFGLTHVPGDAVTCADVINSSRGAIKSLNKLYDSLPEGSPMTLAQRGLIVQTVAALQDFLVDLSSFTLDGELNRSDVSPVVKYCIHMGRVLGQLSQGLEAMKFEMSRPQSR